MSKSENFPSLAVLEALNSITQQIELSGDALTATKLKRTLDLNEAIFDEAADYGCTKKHLKWNSHNRYTLLKPFVVPEEAYYPVILESLVSLWVEDGYDKSNFYIENTSRRDTKIEGPWTRPDLTLVSHKKFPWTIGSEFDVVTFEIKRPDSANVLAVFEALSHVSAATRGYVVFPVDPDTWRSSNPAQERRVKDECVRHGVGLILVQVGGAVPAAHHVLKASRREIDHEKCNDFLDAVLSPSGKRRISEWKS
ncbi:hypothetical protein PWG15_26635 (plasmid) [Ensifer adhaerens]|uniref:hypothetical protein n=1 Tax=Ensifer adhaerens TaxID=106592 RepID=UPI0023A951B1|nr:hypothetical protein [Ensifer adhaerens]WDZ79064.1 hypothetical protein PWG15_26635 [Ensifer adhaerens]